MSTLLQANPEMSTKPLKPGVPNILMSPPDHFTVAYAINPWMTQGPVDTSLAMRQWDNLYKAISEKAGAEVHLVPPVEGLPDLVFTANAAFVYENTAIVARFKYPERNPEEPHYIKWFMKHGFNVVTLDDSMPFEGAGDALKWRDTVFAGYKTRTDILSHRLITQKTGLRVLALELIDPKFYHIDVCICPLTHDYFIYYPEAFDEYGQAVIEATIPAEKRIPVTQEEAYKFACNTVCINDTVLFNQGSDRLAGELTERGFQVIQVDLSEFLKAGGSAKCLTLRVA